MSNIISFRPRERLPGEVAMITSPYDVSATASRSDGVAFAVAAGNTWLSTSLSELAQRLEAAVQMLGPELAAVEFDLNIPFVSGFAEQLARSDRNGATLTVELSLTAAGFAADTFCWKTDLEVTDIR